MCSAAATKCRWPCSAARSAMAVHRAKQQCYAAELYACICAWQAWCRTASQPVQSPCMASVWEVHATACGSVRLACGVWAPRCMRAAPLAPACCMRHRAGPHAFHPFSASCPFHCRHGLRPHPSIRIRDQAPWSTFGCAMGPAFVSNPAFVLRCQCRRLTCDATPMSMSVRSLQAASGGGKCLSAPRGLLAYTHMGRMWHTQKFPPP